MSKKVVLFPAEVVELIAPYAVSSGGGMQVGVQFAVAINDLANAEQGAVYIRGVHTLAKTTGTAWTQGQQLYWDDSGKKVTHTSNSAANIAIGTAYVAAASGDATGQVLLK